MKTGLPKKFLSRRDKNGHRRSKSPDGKHRPLSTEAFFALFKPNDAAKQPDKDEEKEQEKREQEAVQVGEVIRRLNDLGYNDSVREHVLYALRSNFSAGNVDKAVDLMVLQQKSLAGKLMPYNPTVHMLGAENRGNVTCYLDALLFAMFAKLEAFECMLTDDPPDDNSRRLAALLRLWVNMLRTGKLIQTDMTQHLQDALAACGWPDAQLLEQQDTSEAFAFITETLQLPLLTLQVDLFHQGKKDEADHKVVYERLLNLAIPTETEGKGVRLEDCLEDYFNSKVDVHRDSLEEKKARRATLTMPSPATPMASILPLAPDTPRSTTIRLVDGDGEVSSASSTALNTHEESRTAPLERRWTDQQAGESSGTQSPQTTVRPHRSRTESIIQRVVLDDTDKSSEADTANLFERAKRKVSVVKAVTIPAWQFFRLIPWHSPAHNEPQSDLEVARHFSQRPVVGICLKRYMMDEQGVPRRQNTFIDIPDSLRLPHFIVDDRHVEENGLSKEYKLVLQSVVCHRGDSLHSGHYISFCRVAPKLLTDNRRHEKDPPPDYEEAQWVKFDDLAFDDRVAPIDDIKESLKEEMPYLLFYQIVPIVDITTSSTDGTDVEPPSYDDSTINLKISEASTGSLERPPISRSGSSYFDNPSQLPSTAASVRFSADLERPSRHSFADDDGFLNVSRRGSVYDHSAGHSPSGSGYPSPVATPAEESTAQRLSRAAAKFRRKDNSSRPQSQAGEGRLSQTMSRIGLSSLMRSSKEPLRESNNDETASGEEEDFEFISINGTTNHKETKDKDKEKEKEKETHHKKSKMRSEKGKTKENKAKPGDVPDRECVVQ